MGFSVIPNRPFSYTLEQHRELPEGDRPTFRLRYLGSRTLGELSRLMAEDPGRAFFIVACAGIVGWTGLERDGEPFEFEPAPTKPRLVHGITIAGGAAEACVDALPYAVLAELAQQILNANTLDRDSAKN